MTKKEDEPHQLPEGYWTIREALAKIEKELDHLKARVVELEQRPVAVTYHEVHHHYPTTGYIQPKYSDTGLPAGSIIPIL